MVLLIIISIVFLSIGVLYAKMILIWRDVQLEQLEKIKKYLDKINEMS